MTSITDLFIQKHKYLKGDLLCKNHFYKVFEHSCVAAVCENNQPNNGKNPPNHSFIKPINHKQSLQTSCFRFSLCSRHRGEQVPPICDALCSFSINTALREKMRSAITGDIYTVSTKEALQVLCFVMDEHRSRHNLPSSEPRTLWLHFIFEGNIPEKISNVP